MKYSVFTVQLPDYMPEQAVEALQQNGYQGVEWRVAPRILEDKADKKDRYWKNNKATLDIHHIYKETQEILPICAKHGIEIISLTTYLTLDQRKEIEEVLIAAKNIGCPMIRVNPYNYTGEENYQALFEKSREELKEAEALGRKYGIQINLEIHMGNIIPSASAARRLLEGFDSKWIGVIYDAGNMVHEGYEQYKMGFEILGDFIHHIHIKDARWVKDMDNQGNYTYRVEWCPIGKGVVNFSLLLEAIKKQGYKGYLSFEDFSEEYTNQEKLKMNISYISKLIQSKEENG